MHQRNELEGTLELLKCLNQSSLGLRASFSEQQGHLILSISREDEERDFVFKDEEIADFTPGQFVEYLTQTMEEPRVSV